MSDGFIICENRYFLRALQIFAHLLCMGKESAFLEETDAEKLIDFISKREKELPKEKIYYYAGRASQQVQIEAVVNSCDCHAECLGGLYLFDEFLGLEVE